VAEVLKHFAPSAAGTLLDATLGLGGHAAAYLAAAGEGSSVVGFEADPAALREAQQRLASFAPRVIYVNRNFASIAQTLQESTEAVPEQFDYVLFDLGVGSHQLEESERGFSFGSTAPLLMRYGDQTGLPDARLDSLNYLADRLRRLPEAVDIIRGLREEDLVEILFTYGEERFARKIARALRALPAEALTAAQVADVIRGAVPARMRHRRLHPATKTFQALRLAVNRELEALEVALPQAVSLLAPGGMIAVISFHSLEDRIVKRFFRAATELVVVTKKPIVASEEERQKNRRSRSAKLRIAQKQLLNKHKQKHDQKSSTTRYPSAHASNLVAYAAGYY
jgi:16S rRNA (cytosine1402-N4)-methyltransferase